MGRMLSLLINKVLLLALLLFLNFTNAQIWGAPFVTEGFVISVQNMRQTAPDKLEFDVYLLDTDASQPFELGSCQLGFLFNSSICAGGTVSASISHTGSGLNDAQLFTATPIVVNLISGYPDQTFIRLAGRTTPGAGNGTFISTTAPGTLLTHLVIRNTVNFTGISNPYLAFTSSSEVTPLYATRVSEYIDTINTPLTVIPGTNAIGNGDPVLNGDVIISVQNITQTAVNKLEFDVFLLDTDASQPFELGSCQLSFLLNSLIFTGGGVSATVSNTGSGLNAAQQFTALPDIISSLADYPDQTFIRLAGRTTPGAENGTLISTTVPGTLLTHFTITSSVSYTANSTPNLVFSPSVTLTPEYAARNSQYINTTNTPLTVVPGINAIVDGNPVLNPTFTAPTAFAVTGGGPYCQDAGGFPVGVANSEVSVTYTLIKDGVPMMPTMTGTGAAITFGNQLYGTYIVSGTNAGCTTAMTGSVANSENPATVGGAISGASLITYGDSTGVMTLGGYSGTVVKMAE